MKYLEKKMKNKFLTFILLLFLFSSCSGLGVKRSDKSDEFLIEKKNPLVMPPDIDDLPKPEKNTEILENGNFGKVLGLALGRSSPSPSGSKGPLSPRRLYHALGDRG